MHNDDGERADSGDQNSEANAVIAADDTGMVGQQEVLIMSELDDAALGDVETGVGSEAERP
jgi:hypothetical protein